MFWEGRYSFFSGMVKIPASFRSVGFLLERTRKLIRFWRCRGHFNARKRHGRNTSLTKAGAVDTNASTVHLFRWSDATVWPQPNGSDGAVAAYTASSSSLAVQLKKRLDSFPSIHCISLDSTAIPAIILTREQTLLGGSIRLLCEHGLLTLLVGLRGPLPFPATVSTEDARGATPFVQPQSTKCQCKQDLQK